MILLDFIPIYLVWQSHFLNLRILFGLLFFYLLFEVSHQCVFGRLDEAFDLLFDMIRLQSYLCCHKRVSVRVNLRTSVVQGLKMVDPWVCQNEGIETLGQRSFAFMLKVTESLSTEMCRKLLYILWGMSSRNRIIELRVFCAKVRPRKSSKLDCLMHLLVQIGGWDHDVGIEIRRGVRSGTFPRFLGHQLLGKRRLIQSLRNLSLICVISTTSFGSLSDRKRSQRFLMRRGRHNWSLKGRSLLGCLSDTLHSYFCGWIEMRGMEIATHTKLVV